MTSRVVLDTSVFINSYRAWTRRGSRRKILPMSYFSDRLKIIARERGLSIAQMARICEISERTYANYSSGSRQPDFETLIRICARLGVTPNDVLLNGYKPDPQEERDALMRRLLSVAEMLSDHDVEKAIIAFEAIALRYPRS